MLWFMVAILITIVVVVALGKSEGWGIAAAISIPVLLLFGVAALVFSDIAGDIITTDNDIVWEEKSAIDLYALQDGKSINGSRFFLGSGYINEELYYYYVTSTGKGYKVEKISSDKAYIQYTEGAPRLITYVGSRKPGKYDLYSRWDESYYFVLEVPEGTIVMGYNVDLE